MEHEISRAHQGARVVPPIMVMGVQGSGKSTIGVLLAERIGAEFVDGDDLHSEENIASMAAGEPLTDAQRQPWLREVARVLQERAPGGIVVACSALKREYRDLIRQFVPGLFVVNPAGSIELITARIREREHEFMPTTLLRSQYAILETLENDEAGVTVDVRLTPSQIVDDIVRALGEQSLL